MLIPVRKANEIIYEREWNGGGRSGVCYYNIWEIKIKADIKFKKM